MDLKKSIIALLSVAILLFAFYIFWSNPFYPPSGGCHFGVIASLNEKINSSEDVQKALLNNGWKTVEGFDVNQIELLDSNNVMKDRFIKDKTLRYWSVGFYKEGEGRAELIDENGQLYVFYNCV